MSPTMPRRMAIIGAECSGKSTLARALARTLPGCLVEESLREFVRERARTPTRGEQAGILARQQEQEEAAARDCDLPWVVVDSSPLMTAVYSRLYFHDDSLVPAAARAADGYALVVWCGIDIPWVPDDIQRDGPDHRARADALVADLVRTELEPRGIRVVQVLGSIEDRAAAVGRAWQPGASPPPT